MIIRWEILIDLLLAMFCCLIIIAVMRWVATPLVWLSILGVLVSLGAGKCCKRHEFSLKNILLMSKCIHCRNILFHQTIHIFEKSSANRCKYPYESKFVSRYMVFETKYLAIHWNCRRYCVDHYLLGGACSSKTNRYCYCTS